MPGGEGSIESPLGQGVTFTMRLPARAVTFSTPEATLVAVSSSLRPDFDTNRYILAGNRERGLLNYKTLWISSLDTWPKILDTSISTLALTMTYSILYPHVHVPA
jgi:hypothetical protein